MPRRQSGGHLHKMSTQIFIPRDAGSKSEGQIVLRSAIAPSKRAFSRLASAKFAPLRFVSRRSASISRAFEKSTSVRLLLRNEEPIKMESENVALRKVDPSNRARDAYD